MARAVRHKYEMIAVGVLRLAGGTEIIDCGTAALFAT
jgi:hypothetical protein